MMVNVHDPSGLADPLTESFEVEGGYQYEIKHSPSGVLAHDSLQSIPLHHRQCKMPSEANGQQIMNIYTQRNCKFENMIKELSRSLNCQPWDLPTLNSTMKLCSISQAFKMYDMIKTAAAQSNGNCPEACQSIAYQYNIKSEALQLHPECWRLSFALGQNNSSFNFPHPMEALLNTRYVSNEQEKRNLLKFDSQRHFDCMHLLKDTSIINIKPGTTQVNIITQRKRVSFTSQLAVFGKLKLVK